MVTSWYVASGCVSADSLEPFSLIIIGLIIQSCMTIVFSLNNVKQMEREDKEAIDHVYLMLQNQDPVQAAQEKYKAKPYYKRAYERWTHSKCYRFLQKAYIAYKTVSVLIILALDIITIYDKLSLMPSSGRQYLCLSSILLTSSNAKTLLSFVFIGLMAHVIEQEAQEDRQVKRDYCKLFFVFFVSIIAFSEFIALYLCLFFGLLAYIWTIMPVSIVPAIVMCSCEERCNKVHGDLFFFSAAFLGGVCYCVLFMLCSLAFINLCAGLPYMDSIFAVFNERHWSSYISYTLLSIENKYRFVTMLF